MKRVVVLLIASVGAAGMVSCSKEPTPAPAAPAAPSKAVSVGDDAAAPPPPAAPVDAAAAPADAPEGNQVDYAAAARMLTKGLKDYVAAKKKFPPNLEEVKAAGFLQTVPDPPSGMRWHLDPKKNEVTAAGYAVGL
jgi:TolA-binding protein